MLLVAEKEVTLDKDHHPLMTLLVKTKELEITLLVAEMEVTLDKDHHPLMTLLVKTKEQQHKEENHQLLLISLLKYSFIAMQIQMDN